jgi:hypothetical protein
MLGTAFFCVQEGETIRNRAKKTKTGEKILLDTGFLLSD